MKMALISQSSLTTSCSASATTNKRHFLLLPHHHHTLLSIPIPKSILLPPIKSQKSSEPPISTESTDDNSSSTGRKKSKKKGRKVIRRAPVETPQFVPIQAEAKLEEEQSGSEKAFVSAWLGLGSIIIIQGLLLAASGFFPEEWDKLFVKYLYPAFTPTVFLFVAGTVVYGLLKYQQNEKPQSPK